MDFKIIEVRDEGTRIDCLAMRMAADGPVQDHYLWCHGYPRYPDQPAIVLMILHNQKATSDPYEWTQLRMGPRTMPVAHTELIDNWDRYKNGDVVDVQFVLKETAAPKKPERHERVGP